MSLFSNWSKRIFKNLWNDAGKNYEALSRGYGLSAFLIFTPLVSMGFVLGGLGALVGLGLGAAGVVGFGGSLLFAGISLASCTVAGILLATVITLGVGPFASLVARYSIDEDEKARQVKQDAYEEEKREKNAKIMEKKSFEDQFCKLPLVALQKEIKKMNTVEDERENESGNQEKFDNLKEKAKSNSVSKAFEKFVNIHKETLKTITDPVTEKIMDHPFELKVEQRDITDNRKFSMIEGKNVDQSTWNKMKLRLGSEEDSCLKHYREGEVFTRSLEKNLQFEGSTFNGKDFFLGAKESSTISNKITNFFEMLTTCVNNAINKKSECNYSLSSNRSSMMHNQRINEDANLKTDTFTETTPLLNGSK